MVIIKNCLLLCFCNYFFLLCGDFVLQTTFVSSVISVKVLILLIIYLHIFSVFVLYLRIWLLIIIEIYFFKIY